ncbi:hypothetical protein ILUMI_11983 [Ignelater luminosus]|uniref:N-acetyltransferase domain-containing protein n=1 Tax=Ignelater luminosus TaxID=2038154 RepID=A0A8K0GDE9_IGNLU|nr:hypothetical protein ILUMI_11983 [Ignelater luminosus]
MTEKQDILETIPDEVVIELREKYRNAGPHTAYVYNFLNCALKWKRLCPNKNFFTLLAPNGNCTDGTFIAIQSWSCYDIFLYTLDEDTKVLYEALAHTKSIDWKRLIVLYAVQKDQFPMVLQALNKVEFPIHHSNVYDVWWMSKQKALGLSIDECPSEVYVQKLDKVHAAVINSYWDSRFPNSEEYLSTFIELNGGYGVFTKTTNKLVSWVLKNQIGLGAVETLKDYKRKGYASLVVKHMAKKCAEEGEDPLGTVLQGNITSQAMFKKLGFTIINTVVFTEAEISR